LKIDESEIESFSAETKKQIFSCIFPRNPRGKTSVAFIWVILNAFPAKLIRAVNAVKSHWERDTLFARRDVCNKDSGGAFIKCIHEDLKVKSNGAPYFVWFSGRVLASHTSRVLRRQTIRRANLMDFAERRWINVYWDVVFYEMRHHTVM